MRSLPYWNRKFVLRGLFVISAVFILSLSGPHNTLLAQQNTVASPAATPVPDDYWSNLPICPDYIFTPSVEPTPMGSGDAIPTCRLSPEHAQVVGGFNPLYQQWLDQGRDLRELGYYGDPVPDPAQMFPTLTPVAQAALEGAPGTASQPALLRQPQLYLPLLQNGAILLGTATELSATPVPTATIIYTDRLNAPYIPIDQLPECENVTFNVPDYSVPDFNAPQCRAKIIASVDLKALYDQGVDLQELGIAGDPPRTDATTLQGNEMESAAANGTLNFSWAQNDLTIPAGYSGISNIFGVASGKTPALMSGYSWQNYHYYNRLQLGSSSANYYYCGQLSKLAIGVGYGTFDVLPGTIQGAPALVWERYTNQGCGMYLSNITTTSGLRLYIVNVGLNHFLGQVYYYGQWVTIFDQYVNWGLGTRVAAGHQLWARNQDKQNIIVPTNFTSQLALNGYPWADSVFSLTRPELIGATIVYADAPFNVIDGVATPNKSFTSISVTAN